MASVAQPLYALPTNPAVKWLATQDRNLNRDLDYPDPSTETPEEYVSRIYLQFLWLPQSIMPLQFLIPAMLRITTTPPSSTASQQSPAGHPLHRLLEPILLTSRAASQKYHTRITQALAEEGEPADSEEEYMWYAYHKDKVGEDEQTQEGQDEYEVQERLKHSWLEKFERREVQIQILLYFLLMSLPKGDTAQSGDTGRPVAESLSLPLSLSPSKSKKRRRKEREREGAGTVAAPPQPLEERLESYMDKLAMWQLMQSVDNALGHRDTSKSAAAKGKERQKDDRDWMQVFCEDVVESLFKVKLPELCALFRSKIFPDAGNSDTDSLELSPPMSPKLASKRLKSSSSKAAASSSSSTAKGKGKGKGKGKDKDADLRVRSRSLSLSLEQEKQERSRTLSIGPNGLRKRATVFEVTMTTKFSKARKQKVELGRTASVSAQGPSLSRTQSLQSSAAGPSAEGAKRGEKASKAVGMGSVLVAATPTKPRAEMSGRQLQRTQSQSQSRLPALFSAASGSSWSRSQSQSQSLQLQSHSRSQPQSTLSRVDSLTIDTDEEEEEDEDVGLVATPTKARRSSTLSLMSEDGENEGESEDWKFINLPDALQLSASSSQGYHTSEDDGPPASSSSPGDLGGFGDVDTPPRAGSGRGRILVGVTPTKGN